MMSFEALQLLKAKMPGWEKAYLVCVAPFLGSRGGPCIEGTHVLTMHECWEGSRFDDVIYVYGERRALQKSMEKFGEPRFTDVPYGVMVPKELDGLLAVGRSASAVPDTLLRNREGVMYMGQAGGTAAALAAASGVQPRDLDVRRLQRLLLEAGFYLGEPARLAQLGLA